IIGDDVNGIWPKDAERKTFYGHSDNVTNVCFLSNESHLVSLGEDDCCIFVWKCIAKANSDDDD
ncbi:unnamed protein product, partial [Rotaria sordida]